MKIIDKNINPQNRGDQWLVRYKGKFYVVSHINNEFGNEVLAFNSDSSGNIEDWGQVVGLRHSTHEEVIELLKSEI